MFVEESPGFARAADRFFDELLESAGLHRATVLVTSLVDERPADNAGPEPAEIARCRPRLHEQLRAAAPRVVCPLGNAATKALRNDPTPLVRVRGRVEERDIGPVRVRLLPLLHPAAALYDPRMQAQLRADFALIPGLLERPEAAQLGLF